MTEKKCVLYHNPRCAKSRAALALLQEHGVEPEIVEYLKTPLGAMQLTELVRKLGIKPAELVRTGEETFKQQFKGKALSDAEWIAVLADNPILIERPILVCGDKAVVGRPPENVLALL